MSYRPAVGYVKKGGFGRPSLFFLGGMDFAIMKWNV